MATTVAASGPDKVKTVRLRWVILALLFLSTGLNYIDRQALSILASTVQADLGIDDRGYAAIVQLFLVAYTAAFLLSGRIVDRLGVKLSLALFVGWWSLANMATGLAQSARGLGASRFLLGLGEAGVYTAAPKVASEWFPPRERALAHGVYTAGAMVGATVAPPLIGWLGHSYGWRTAFLATGAAGLLWLIPWWLIYRAPRAAESAALGVAPPSAVRRGGEAALWREVLRQRAVWLLIGARVLADGVWYFYLFWFPKYLSDARGLDLLDLARVAWVVYLAADVGSILGGIASGRLVKRGADPAASRLKLMRAAALLAPAGALVALQPGLWATLALAAFVVFWHQVWQVNLGALIIDLTPSSKVGTVFGVIAAGSGLGGILFTAVIAETVTAFSYEPVFAMMALLHPAAWLLARLVDRRRPNFRDDEEMETA